MIYKHIYSTRRWDHQNYVSEKMRIMAIRGLLHTPQSSESGDSPPNFWELGSNPPIAYMVINNKPHRLGKVYLWCNTDSSNISTGWKILFIQHNISFNIPNKSTDTKTRLYGGWVTNMNSRASHYLLPGLRSSNTFILFLPKLMTRRRRKLTFFGYVQSLLSYNSEFRFPLCF